MNTAKVVLYSVVVLCFLVAGAMDCWQGNWRIGIVAIMVGIVQGLVFIGGRT